MNDLTTTTAGTPVNMTSIELAELTGKRHDNVMADIRKMLVELYGDGRVLSFQETVNRPNPSGGAPIRSTIFKLPKRETLILVSGYSVAMRAKIIDRWQELESATGVRVPTTLAAALRLAADLEEQKLLLQQQAAADAPKIAFAEAVRDTEGLCKLEQIAKTLNWGRNRFIDRLRADGVLLQDRAPYQKYLDAGYFKVIEQKPWTDSKGNEHPSFTTMVTGKGQVWLAKRYAGVPA